MVIDVGVSLHNAENKHPVDSQNFVVLIIREKVFYMFIILSNEALRSSYHTQMLRLIVE